MTRRASHLRPVDSSGPEPSHSQTQRPSAARVAEAMRGDTGAWAELYAGSYPTLFRQLRYLTGDDTLAEELAQETFARAIAGASRYDAARPFPAWISGIALNVVRKYWRKRHNTTTAHTRLQILSTVHGGVPEGSPLEGQVQRERSRMLYEVLQTLPDRWREAFILREIEGLSVEEAAQRLDVSRKNVSVRAARARARIREEIVARGWADDPHSTEGAW